MDERAKVGYQMTIQLIAYEGQIIWRSFQGLLTANSVLIVLVGAIIKFYPNYAILKNVLAVAGLLLCLCWILVQMRQSDYYIYWFAWARFLERTHFSPVANIVTEGERFSRGETPTIDPNDRVNVPRMRWGSRLFRVEWLIYFVIAIFVGIYIALLSVSPEISGGHTQNSGS